jgi:hypothetical protein
MQPGRACDDDEIHRAVCQESVEVLKRGSAVLVAESADFLRVAAVDGRDFNSGNRAGCPRVGLAHVPTTGQTYVHGHFGSPSWV